MSDTIVFDFDFDASRLIRAFSASDDIGSIIRVHYELERVLTHVLSKYFPKPDKLNASTVGPKLARLEALGFSGPRIKLAAEINSLRNNFAHRDKEELTSKDISTIEQQAGALTAGRFPTPNWRVRMAEFSGEYGNLRLRQKFVVIAGFSIAALAALPHEVDAAIGVRRSQSAG